MKGIGFYGVLDFFPKRKELKEEYEKMTLDEKILYKKQVYSICFEREYVKDLIWEYLNGWEESQFNLGKEWRIKKKKTDKRYQKYNELKKKREESNENNNTNEVGQLERYYW